MATLMRRFDWTNTPLGDVDHWPQSLRAAVRILLTSQHPMFIWWGSELIQFYNDAYRKTMGPERHPSALGQRGKECWAEIWDIIGPQIEYVMDGKGATWHENQLVPVTRHGKREDVWWTYSYGPIDDEASKTGVGGVLVVCNDVTDRHRAMESLAINEERLEFALSEGRAGTWDWHVDADKVFTNEALAKLYGVDPGEAETGAPVERFFTQIHDDDRDRLKTSLKQAVLSGKRFSEEYRIVQPDGKERWISARGRCFTDSHGVRRFPGVAMDITARRKTDAHLEFLMNEMNHRIKNTLMIIQSISNQTFTNSDSLEDAKTVFTGRLMALAASQDVLAGKRSAGSDIETVIKNATRHQGITGNRFRINGPHLSVSSPNALYLALAIHELTTNAAKYGALADSRGSVEITWELDENDAAGSRFRLEWVEKDGPPVEQPVREGFGSRLLNVLLTSQFDGSVTLGFEKSGVRCTINAPYEKIRDLDAID